MRLSSLKCVIVVFSLICILFALLKAQELSDFEQLTLEITTNVQEVLPIEPMPITITLSNNTEKPITGHNQIDPGTGFLKIYVAKADKPFEHFHSSDRPSLTGIRGDDVLKPGYRTSFSGYFFYAHPANLDKEKNGQYLFEEPGIYRIKATFEDMEGESKIESNVLTVEAKQPTGQDAAAYEFLKNLREEQDEDVYYGNFLLTTFGRNITPRKQKVLDKKEEFLSRFPKSRYARYVYYSLGENYRLDVGKGVGRGIKLLEKAAGYEDFFLAKDVLLKLIETLEEQGQSSNAWKYKNIFAKRFPDNAEGSDYVEQVYMAAAERRRSTWPLILVGVVAGIGILYLVFLLKKKAHIKSK